MYGDGILYSGPTAYGSELVINGTFDNNLDNWNLTPNGQTIVWENGKVRVTSDGTFASLQQSITTVVGQVYRARVDIDVTSGSNLALNVGGTQVHADGKKTLEMLFTATGTSTTFQLKRYSGAVSGTFDNATFKQITQGSDFDFTRASTGTRINEEGYIEDVPYNLATYSEDFPLWSSTGTITRTSNIAIAPDGTLTADGIQDTTGGTFKRVRTNISVSGNSTFTGSCFIKKVSSETGNTGFALVFSGTSTKVAYGIIDSVNGTMISQSSTITPVFKIESANNDYWRFSMTATDTGSNTSLEFSIYGTLSSNGTSVSPGAGSLRTIWGAQLVKGDKVKDYLPTTDRLNLPRLNYPTYGGCPSLLVEPQRTNLITYSNDFSNVGWIKQGGISSTYNTTETLSPEGLYNASKFTGDGTNGVYRQVIVTGVVARSIYLKSVAGNVSCYK